MMKNSTKIKTLFACCVSVLLSCSQDNVFDYADVQNQSTYFRTIPDAFVKYYYTEIRNNGEQFVLIDIDRDDNSYNELKLSHQLEYQSHESYTLSSDVGYFRGISILEVDGINYAWNFDEPTILHFSDGLELAEEIIFEEINIHYNYSKPFVGKANELITTAFESDAYSRSLDKGNFIYWFHDLSEVPSKYSLPNKQIGGDVFDVKVFGQDQSKLWLLGSYYNSNNQVRLENRKIFSAIYDTASQEILALKKYKGDANAINQDCILHQCNRHENSVVFVRELTPRFSDTYSNWFDNVPNGYPAFDVVKVNNKLEEEWSVNIDFDVNEADPTGFITTADGGFIVVGITNFNRPKMQNNFVVKISSEGKVVFKKIFDNFKKSFFISACGLQDGRIAVLGSSYLFGDGYEQFVITLTANGELE